MEPITLNHSLLRCHPQYLSLKEKEPWKGWKCPVAIESKVICVVRTHASATLHISEKGPWPFSVDDEYCIANHVPVSVSISGSRPVNPPVTLFCNFFMENLASSFANAKFYRSRLACFHSRQEFEDVFTLTGFHCIIPLFFRFSVFLLASSTFFVSSSVLPSA